ncbi:undecaprenyl-diphosphatase BcrC [bacterium BMS3Abin02]|nr:undecaprenyl-diphosphatase BcrC [bacterium BMS3Abin02]HDL50309.1 phosphatase PAP2 family protein [Actinomycetota bacterium]
MGAILRWGIDVVLWLQQASPSLDGLFKTLTFLGSEEFYLLLLPLVYWSVDRVIGMRLIVLLLFSNLVNTAVKLLAAQPRPFAYDARVKAITSEVSFGFPSGHTQNTVAVWGYLGSRVRAGWFWLLAGLLMVGVPLSRIYLGVHFPTDVLGGYLIGAIVLWLFLRFWKPVERWFCGLALVWQLAITMFAPAALLAFHVSESVTTGVGTMVGMGVGFVLERHWVRFETAGPIMHRVLRFLIGLVVLIGLWAGLRTLFAGIEPAMVLRFIRYGLVGLWGAFGAPWLFVRLRIASQSTMPA